MFMYEIEGYHSGVAEYVNLVENVFIYIINAPGQSMYLDIFTQHMAEHFKWIETLTL